MIKIQIDWKIYVFQISVALVILFASNCIWITYHREEINRQPLDLTPLPESLLVLGDSAQTNEHIFIYQNLPLKHIVQANGKFDISYESTEEQYKLYMDSIDCNDVQNLIFELNKTGFFNLSDEKSLYEYYMVKRTYLFGFLKNTSRELKLYLPNNPECHVDFMLENFTIRIDYYGNDNVCNKSSYSIELNVLRDGFEEIERFFKTKIHNINVIGNFPEDMVIPDIPPDRAIKPLYQPAPLIWPASLEFPQKGYIVFVKLLIGPEGKVIHSLILKSSGNLLLDRLTLEAVNRWVFIPPKYNGKPGYVWIGAPVRYRTQ